MGASIWEDPKWGFLQGESPEEALFEGSRLSEKAATLLAWSSLKTAKSVNQETHMTILPSGATASRASGGVRAGNTLRTGSREHSQNFRGPGRDSEVRESLPALGRRQKAQPGVGTG